MRRHRHHVDRKLLDVDHDMSRRLYAVDVEHHAAAAAYLAELFHRLDRADLVVGEHDRRQYRLGADRRFQVGGGDHPFIVDGEYRIFKAHLSQPFNGVEDGVMLDGAGYDMVSQPLFLQRPGRALDSQVVGLAARAGENDIGGLRVDQRRHLRARVIHRRARLASELVKAVGVAVFLREVGEHRLRYSWVHLCRCRIVKIYFAWCHACSPHKV